MSEIQVTQEKVRALLDELRTWDAGEERCTLQALMERFELDRFVVERVARSEGFYFRDDREPPPSTDPNASTLDLDPDEIQRALTQPETNPDYLPDQDTGLWRKNPTGDWELIRKKPRT